MLSTKNFTTRWSEFFCSKKFVLTCQVWSTYMKGRLRAGINCCSLQSDNAISFETNLTEGYINLIEGYFSI